MAKSRSSKSTKKPATQTAAKAEKKTEKVIALLRREGGATLSEITDATAWLPHSARAVLSGFRKKGFIITKAKVDGATRWSITGEPAA